MGPGHVPDEPDASVDEILRSADGAGRRPLLVVQLGWEAIRNAESCASHLPPVAVAACGAAGSGANR